MPSTLFSDSFMQPSPSPKSKPKNPKLRCRRCHQGSYEQSKNSNEASEAGFGIFLRFKKKKNLFNCSWLVVLGNWNYQDERKGGCYNPKNQNFFLWVLLHIAIEIFVLGLSLFSISIFVCGMQIMCLMKCFNELSMTCEVISN